MFEPTFKKIDDIPWREVDCTTELDYTEQTSWLLFLRDLGTFILDEDHRWSVWAAMKKEVIAA